MKRYSAGRLLGIACLILGGMAFAQSDRGSIAGTVTDSTGAVVSGASVVLRGVDNGIQYKTQTTGEGVYRISDLAIGRYDVTVESQGFKSSVQKGVLIQINTVAALNVSGQANRTSEAQMREEMLPALLAAAQAIGQRMLRG